MKEEPETTYPGMTTIDVGRGGVQIRISGIPCRTDPVGGETMIPGAIALEIGDAIEAILGAVERYRATREVDVAPAG